MDGDPVEGKPSDKDVGIDGKSSVPTTLTELFYKLCPSYMAMGMTWEEYWNQNTKVHKAVREAWEQQKQYDNWKMWMQGAYIYEALLKVSPVMRASFGKGKVEAGKYSTEPYPLTEKEAKEREEARRESRIKRLFELLSAESSETLKQKEASENG